MTAGSAPPRSQGPATRRFYVVSADAAPVGYDRLDVAITVAKQYGDGAEVVDTEATPYHPMVQRIERGEPVFLPYGAWDTKGSLNQNLIEAAKKGHPPIVAAFLAKGADVNARDGMGGSALMWAVARRSQETVALLIAAGADPNARDRNGQTALKLARAKSLGEITDRLIRAGAVE